MVVWHVVLGYVIDVSHSPLNVYLLDWECDPSKYVSAKQTVGMFSESFATCQKPPNSMDEQGETLMFYGIPIEDDIKIINPEKIDVSKNYKRFAYMPWEVYTVFSEVSVILVLLSFEQIALSRYLYDLIISSVKFLIFH